jgi:hypothetical protein
MEHEHGAFKVDVREPVRRIADELRPGNIVVSVASSRLAPA